MVKIDKKLPIGVDSFETLIRQNCYYLDKTGFISQLINWHGAVNLFTRPRRFGKTLNMSMLKAFFETGTDKSLFDGLKISKEREICDAYQGKYPVLFLSMKGIEGETFEKAYARIAVLVSNECKRLAGLSESQAVLDVDKRILNRLIEQTATEANLQDSLSVLMRMLRAHYGKQVILLIDEYDVPLDKAGSKGFYSEMVDFLRVFFGGAFKTNPDLYFAVVTGCLRISKESIFTGLNNLKVDTISDKRYDEYFGFTDADVTTRSELEMLIAGESIEKKLVENLTYGELDENPDHLWSVLYLTGYLTADRRAEGEEGLTRLMIPNREVREIFVNKIQKWFGEKVVWNHQLNLYEELWNCQAEALQQRIREILYDTISYHDYHENYYHALLAGLLLDGRYHVKPYYEMGAGRSDITVEDAREKRAIIIETKRSKDYDELEEDSEKALSRIEMKEYAWPFQRKKYQVIAYGISFEGKECCVKVRQL